MAETTPNDSIVHVVLCRVVLFHISICPNQRGGGDGEHADAAFEEPRGEEPAELGNP